MTPGDIVCATCLDSGWQLFDCPGDRTCDRWRVHRPHTFVRECPCRAGNEAWQEKQRRQRRSREAA